MKVIVIIVTYNGMKWYKNCFNSLQYSTIPLQTIVIDNNSSDNTATFIKENYPEIQLIENPVNLGFGKANNIGFRYAIEQNADYVFLLNQDAWIEPDTMDKLITIQKKYPEYGILSPIHLTGGKDKLDHGFGEYIVPEFCPHLISDFVVDKENIKSVYPIAFVNAALWLISKECLLAVGGFNPLFPHYGEDKNYVNRIHFHNYKLGVSTVAQGVHDREDQKNVKPSFKKKRSRIFVQHLITLLDINKTFSKCIRMYIYSSFVATLRSLLWLSFSDFFIELLVSFRILFKIPQIIKYRKTEKQKGINFL